MFTPGKYSRSVSIIGVGCTPFVYALDNPETAFLSEGEFYGYAAIEAMKDAGIEAKEIDCYFHGQANPLNGSNYITPNMQVADWFGMRGKGSFHHSEACCTGYIALDLAVQAVASGKYDVVLSGCVDLADSLPILGVPAHIRRKFTMDEFMQSLEVIFDRAYTRSLVAGTVIGFDDAAALYMRENNLNESQIDDVLNWMSINNRRNAAHNPMALHQEEYTEIADDFGYNSVMDYMRSPCNPKMGEFLRLSGMEQKCDGAAAVIVCPTEMAYQYNHKPIEVLGVGNCSFEASQCHLETRGTTEAVRQVYETTGVRSEEIDLFFANDFIITSHLISAEIAGYLPKGEGWKYIIDGRTAFDGDKPINTNGGRTSFGHAHGASGLADFYEAVMQMRGECGDRQVRKLPRTTMLRGFGGGQNMNATIIRTVD